MNRNHLWKLLIIVFVVAWSAYEITPPQSRDLLVEFQDPENTFNRDTNYTAIVEQAKKLQAANPKRDYRNLREAIGTNDITVYFPQFQKEAAAEKDPNGYILKRLQRESAGKIKLGLDLQGGSSFLVEMQTNKLPANVAIRAVLENAVEVLRKRVDAFGVAEPLLQPVGDNQILIQMPGLSEGDMDDVRRAIEKTAFLEFRLVHEASRKMLAEGIIPPGYMILKESKLANDGTKVLVEHVVTKEPIAGLSGKNIKSASVIRGNLNEPQISFKFDLDGATAFGKVTTANVGRQLAIILDGELYSAPNINEPITGGSGVISGGSIDEKEAFTLAQVLQNPLEAPVTIVQESSVAPSLGQAAIDSGVKSALYGTIAVAAFMAVYYLLAGVVANVALLTNILILLGVMCSVGTTLTLPGIAGIVLTVGMAVDANVLIFERIREELGKGKSLKGAITAGYDRAFGTIFDSHVTTLISSVILIYMGTGTVKGFGVALTIGVAASLFTALVVTRLIFDFMLAKNLIKGLPMLHFFRVTKLDFMKLAKPAFALSWAVTIIGVGYGIHRGSDALGIDFKGGDRLTLDFAQKTTEDQITAKLTAAGLKDALVQYQRDPNTLKERLTITSAFDTGGKVEEALKREFPASKFTRASLDKVGPTIGAKIMEAGIIAALLSLLGILLYVALRYEFSFAIGAVLAVIHDVLMTIGWYCLSGREFNATTVAAILTIIGFSINDTIVIFDRIREDLKLGVRGSFREIINQALNQTLSRTIITSGTVFLATMSLYIFGGGAINDFAFTFLVGIITGTYSSIYIASALVLWWHKGERPKMASQVVLENRPAAKA